jgi:TPR repeat protein
LAAAAVLLLAMGVAAWYAWPRFQREDDPEERTAETTHSPEPVPPTLRPYLAQAQSGDAKAMHMLAVMYWNGLNVRQDREKGLEWYHKAANAGSTAAQETLKSIEGK